MISFTRLGDSLFFCFQLVKVVLLTKNMDRLFVLLSSSPRIYLWVTFCNPKGPMLTFNRVLFLGQPYQVCHEPSIAFSKNMFLGRLL